MEITRQRFNLALTLGGIRALYPGVLGIRMIELGSSISEDKRVWVPFSVPGMETVDMIRLFETSTKAIVCPFCHSDWRVAASKFTCECGAIGNENIKSGRGRKPKTPTWTWSKL